MRLVYQKNANLYFLKADELATQRKVCESRIGAILGIGLLGGVVWISGAKVLGLLTPHIAATSAVILGIALGILIAYELWNRAVYIKEAEKCEISEKIARFVLGSLDIIEKALDEELSSKEATEGIKRLALPYGLKYDVLLREDEDGDTAYRFPIEKANKFSEGFMLNQIFESSLKLIKQIEHYQST